MANSGKIEYTIGFNVDKSGLQSLKNQLDSLMKITPTDLFNMNPGVFKDIKSDAQSALYYIKQDLKTVQTAFNDAFNPTTGLMNLQKLNVALNQIGADKLSKSFSLLGQKGQDAFYQMTKSALTANMQLKQTNTFLDKMGTTLMNTLKWTFSSSLINRFVGAVQQAVGYVEHLDRSLNDIRIVTKKSADEMEVFGQQANKAAQALGKATTDYTEASLIYYQQGLSDEEVKARAETTLKAANVTGQATKTVSEQLTSVWNGFKVGAEDTEKYVDKLAAVAAMSASNLEELSTGMSKVASAANNLGVDIDQLTAQISTIVSVTRQAPETVGTALKTIYARISDLKLGESDEDGLGLGDVSGGLQKLGINVLDAQGELRDLGTVIEEVAAKWDTWTSAQQAAVAQLMAGKRQYNNLVSLFSNWDMYENAINTSRNATGELQKQQDIYMESTEAHLQQLKTQWEDLYDSLIDPKTIISFADSIKKVVALMTHFVDSIGGGKNAFLLLGSTALRVFEKQIGTGLINVIQGLKRSRENAKQLDAQLRNIEFFKQTEQYKNNPAVKALVDAQDKVSKYYKYLSNEQINEANRLAQEVGEAAKLGDQWKENANELSNYVRLTQQVYGKAKLGRNDKGKLQYQDTSTYDFLNPNKKSSKTDAAVKNRFASTEKSIESLTKKIKEASLEAKHFNEVSTNSGSSKLKKSPDEYFQQLQSKVGDLSKSFQQLKQTNLFSNIEPEKLNDIEKSIDNILNASSGKVATQEFEKLEQLLKGLPQAAQGALEQFRVTFERDIIDPEQAAQEKLQQFLEQANAQNLAINVTGLLGSIGQVTSAINMLTNAFDILGDSSLSAGEKLLRVITAIGMGGSMLITSIGGIINKFNGLSANIAAIIVKKKGLIAVNASVEASEAKLAATTKAVSLTMLGILGGITAVIVGITALVSHYQKVRQEAIERNQSIIEEVNTTQELIDKNKELSDSYKDLIDQYREGSLAQKDFLEQKQKIIASVDAETQAALNAAQTWEQAQKALDNYNKEQAKQQKEEQIKKRNAALELGFDAMSEGYGSYDEENHTFNYAKSMGTKADAALTDRDKQYIKILQDAGFLRGAATENNGEFTYELNFSITADDAGFEKLQQLQQIQDQFAGQISSNAKNIYENIRYQFDELKKGEGYKDLEDALQSISEADLQIAISDSQVNLQKDIEGLSEAQEKFVASLVATGYSTDQAMTEWIKVLSDNGGKAQLELQQRLLDLRTMTQGYFKFFTGDIVNTKKYGQISNIYDQLIEKGFSSEQISGLGEDYWVEIIANGLDDPSLIDKISGDIEEAIKRSYEQAKDKIAETIGSTSDSVGKSISDAISGNLDTTSDEFKELLISLDEIKQVYPELTNEIMTFSDTGLVGTEHWIQVAYDLQSALDKIEFDALIKKSKEAKEELTTIVGVTPQEEVEVIADDKQFQEAMQEIMDANYQIDVEVHSDAERDFTQLVDSMKEADDLASKIGEDFIVAADDIRDLNNAFPGILEGIEYLGDGTIRLNEEIVQSAMQAASEQEAASSQELTTKLHNAATELRAKATAYDSMADIAHQAATKQIKSDEAKTQITQKLNEIEAENDKIASQTEIDNAVAVADNSQVNAGISADNWTKSYQQAADASYEFANTAIQNAAAAARGSGPITKGNFGFTYKGSNGSTSSEAKSATGFQNASTADDWYNQEATYRNMAESARASANDIEGMMVGIAAKAQESIDKNLGVGKSKDSKGKSGGGGKDADHMDYLEREEDIYRVINQELSQIESTLGRIDTVASHEWGADYRDTLKEQNKLLDKQLEKQKEKNKLQKGDLSNRRKQLEQEGVTFSEDGSVMINAEQVLNQLYAGYNVMVGKYNEMSASDQELYKAQMETEKNRIDAIEKKMDEYESTYSDFQKTLDDVLNTHYEIIENEVNQFNNEIEIKLELSNARKEWNEFWAEIVEDVDDNDFGKKIALDMQNLDVLLGLGGNDKGTVGALTKHLKNIVSEVNKQIASADEGGNLSIFGDDTNASHEALQKYISELMTAVKDSEAAIDDIADNYLNTLDSAQDKIDKQLDGWNAIGKQIDHDVDLIKLLTPDNNYDALDKQYQKQYELNQKTLETQRMSKEFWAEQMKINKASMEQFTEGSKEWKAAEKAYEKSVENFRKANDTLNEGIEKSLEDLQTLIENLNDQAIYKLDKALSGGLGLDLMEEEWKLINDEANKYYDNVERYINMEDYTNVLNEAANAVGLSAANQQKLNDFRDQELKQLSERNKLTSYDIEESKARLEILKAQMALEDVQRNKSNMRLRRDSQGNYNYQYTANEDQVDEADNRLLTAKRSWYEIVKKRYQETTEDIINLLKQQTDLATKIKDAEAAGDEARLAKYTELYKANEEAITEAYNQAEKNKRDMYTGTAQYFANVVDRNMLKQSETTARKLVDTWASGGKESVTGAISEAYTTLEKNQEDFVRKTDVLLTAAKVNYENLRKEGIDPTVDSLEDLVDSNDKLDEELTHINDALSQQIVDLANAAKAYEDLKKAAVGALEDANKAMETLSETVVKSQEDIRASIKATQEQVNSINYSNVAPSSSSSSSSSSGSPGGGGILPDPTPSVPQIYTVNAKDRNGFQLTGYPVTKNDKGAAKAEMRKLLNQRQEYSVTINGPEGLLSLSGYMSAENERKLKAYKTGGYTGSWGSEGRLAVLHEKELVLNASDTRNILSAVELLRALPFSALAQSIVDSSSNIAASFRSGVNMNGIGGGTTNNETKSMVVNADFSGVRSADEIYQALIELENYGLQNSYSVAPHANTAY